jgi:hypothetical protein
MRSNNRKFSGLAVCALIAAWLFATDISSRVDDAQSTGDYASGKVDEVEGRLGSSTGY